MLPTSLAEAILYNYVIGVKVGEGRRGGSLQPFACYPVRMVEQRVIYPYGLLKMTTALSGKLIMV